MFNEEILLNQLGGINKLRVMIGALNFLKLENGLSFSFKMCKDANYCVIKYMDGKDLYNMEFLKVNHDSVKTIKNFENLYVEDLKPVFEKFTGLFLSL